ncbi:MAG: ThiF family adenylyltransferase [Dysgonamonadaceae bacterium]|jgi:molybdopterin/thiamine biosynthesis adenylyltransferase|nr:ThiF family adenylyltransferase [Dysgonamonadaceae bacterium]
MEERYSRNRIYVRSEEQQFIRNYRILSGGAGIGGIIAECALRFGFETITVVDGDTVEESNLNCQNYRMEDIGKPKVEALKERLLSINPNANIIAINTFVDADNVEELVKEHDIAINALDFKSNIPIVFDEWCQRFNIPVIHPYNIGWGGLVIVVEPTGPQLKDFTDTWENFEVKLIEHIANYFKFWAKPKPWIENIITQYKNEKSVFPPPQLSVASWIAAGLCTNLLFYIATGQEIKRYPKFYLSSIINDKN